VGEKSDKTVTLVLTVCIVGMAMAIGKRVFLDRPNEGPAPAVTFAPNWRELLPVGRQLGPSGPRIQIVEVADLQCPGCKTYQRSLDEVVDRYDGKVGVLFVHYPVIFHKQARMAHRAAECAARSNRLAAFVRGIYALQDSLPSRSMWDYAKDAGVYDSAGFASCLADTTATDAAIDASIAAGERFDVSRTPTLVVNGWRYASLPGRSHLEDLIDALLAGKTPPGSLPKRD
jgi:protein-disulfide isomerase